MARKIPQFAQVLTRTRVIDSLTTRTLLSYSGKRGFVFPNTRLKSSFCFTPIEPNDPQTQSQSRARRIPKKNIRDFHGKPILAYSIETACISIDI